MTYLIVIAIVFAIGLYLARKNNRKKETAKFFMEAYTAHSYRKSVDAIIGSRDVGKIVNIGDDRLNGEIIAVSSLIGYLAATWPNKSAEDLDEDDVFLAAVFAFVSSGYIMHLARVENPTINPLACLDTLRRAKQSLQGDDAGAFVRLVIDFHNENLSGRNRSTILAIAKQAELFFNSNDDKYLKSMNELFNLIRSKIS